MHGTGEKYFVKALDEGGGVINKLDSVPNFTASKEVFFKEAYVHDYVENNHADETGNFVDIKLLSKKFT